MFKTIQINREHLNTLVLKHKLFKREIKKLYRNKSYNIIYDVLLK